MHQCAYTCLNRSLDMENSTIITPLNWEHKESVKYTYVKSYVPSLYICYIVSYTKHSSKVISQWHATLVAVSITDRGNVIESSTLPLRNCYTEEKIVKTCRSNVFFFFWCKAILGWSTVIWPETFVIANALYAEMLASCDIPSREVVFHSHHGQDIHCHQRDPPPRVSVQIC